MKKITREASEAFRDGKEFHRDNTAVMGGEERRIMTLFGNMIASIEGNRLVITASGWYTATTKERLNGVLDMLNTNHFIKQKDYEWYLVNRVNKSAVPFTGVAEFTI